MADARVIHFEITGKDAKGLQRYYSDLFGWALDDNHPGGYGMTDPAKTGVVIGVGGSALMAARATSRATSPCPTSMPRWPGRRPWAAR